MRKFNKKIDLGIKDDCINLSKFYHKRTFNPILIHGEKTYPISSPQLNFFKYLVGCCYLVCNMLWFSEQQYEISRIFLKTECFPWVEVESSSHG